LFAACSSRRLQEQLTVEMKAKELGRDGLAMASWLIGIMIFHEAIPRFVANEL
jgi:hypothetical protein